MADVTEERAHPLRLHQFTRSAKRRRSTSDFLSSSTPPPCLTTIADVQHATFQALSPKLKDLAAGIPTFANTFHPHGSLKRKMWSSLVNVFVSFTSMVPFLSHLAPPMIPGNVGTCSNPVVRREWRALSADERAAWLNGIKCLANTPHDPSIIETQFDPTQPRLNPNSTFYDDLVFIHNDLVQIIHGTGLFFPWHRHFLHIVEGRMKTDCGFEGVWPYWDWSLDAHDFENSSFWKDSDPESGLGGFGNPDSNMHVQDGALVGLRLAYPYPHLLRRQFAIRPWLNTSIGFHVDPERMVNETFTRAEVARVVNGYVGDYKGFQTDLAALPGMHSSVHRVVGGDLAGQCPDGSSDKCSLGTSPNDPLFYLLHGGLDKIWTDWQNANPANKDLFTGGSVEHMHSTEDFDRYPVGGPPNLTLDSVLPSNGLHGPVPVRDVLSTTGGYLCYVYK